LPFSKGINSVAIVGLALLSVGGIIKSKKIEFQWIVLYPVMVWCSLALSMIYTSNTTNGWQQLYHQIHLLLLPVIFIAHQKELKQHFHFYLVLFNLAVGMAALITLGFYVLNEQTAQTITNQFSLLKPYIIHEAKDAFGAYSPFLDRLHFGYLISIAILTSLFQIMAGVNSRKLLIGINVLVLLGALVILGARAAQLGILLALMLVPILMHQPILHDLFGTRFSGKRASIVFIVAVLLSVLLLSWLLYQNVPAVKTRYNQMLWEIAVMENNTYKDYSYTHFTSIRRIWSWKNTMTLIQQYPLLGVGIGDLNDELALIYQKYSPAFPVNYHQQFLYYWSSAGLLSVAIFMAAFIHFFVAGFRKVHLASKAFCFSFTILYGIVFCLDAPLVYQVGGVSYWWFFLWWLLSQDE
jgi:hypothetical protein